MMHRFPDTGEFGQRIREAELDYLCIPALPPRRLRKTMSGFPIRKQFRASGRAVRAQLREWPVSVATAAVRAAYRPAPSSRPDRWYRRYRPAGSPEFHPPHRLRPPFRNDPDGITGAQERATKRIRYRFDADRQGRHPISDQELLDDGTDYRLAGGDQYRELVQVIENRNARRQQRDGRRARRTAPFGIEMLEGKSRHLFRRSGRPTTRSRSPTRNCSRRTALSPVTILTGLPVFPKEIPPWLSA